MAFLKKKLTPEEYYERLCALRAWLNETRARAKTEGRLIEYEIKPWRPKPKRANQPIK